MSIHFLYISLQSLNLISSIYYAAVYNKHDDLKAYLMIIAGMAIYAIRIYRVLLPHSREIVVGGMAGFSTLVCFASGGVLPVAVTMYAHIMR